MAETTPNKGILSKTWNKFTNTLHHLGSGVKHLVWDAPLSLIDTGLHVLATPFLLLTEAIGSIIKSSESGDMTPRLVGLLTGGIAVAWLALV